MGKEGKVQVKRPTENDADSEDASADEEQAQQQRNVRFADDQDGIINPDKEESIQQDEEQQNSGILQEDIENQNN